MTYLLDDLSGCGLEFWEDCPDYVIEDKIPDCDEDDIYDVIYSDKANNAIEELYDSLEEEPHTGEPCEATPAEDIFEKYFPMFNLKKFLSDIEAEYLSLSGANVVFQCSGEGEALEIVCGAYAEITVNNSFYDRHNH